VFIEDGNKDYLQRNNTPGAPSTSGMPTSTSMSSLHSASTRPVTSNSSYTAVASSNGETKPLINFFKRSLTSEILRDIQQYQSQPYNLARCKPVHDWMLKQLEMIDQSAPDMTELYDISLQLEPREREEERITRMLHDSVGLVASHGRWTVVASCMLTFAGIHLTRQKGVKMRYAVVVWLYCESEETMLGEGFIGGQLDAAYAARFLSTC
jgi:hypothetical protein